MNKELNALNDDDLMQVTGGTGKTNGFTLNVLCSVCNQPMQVPMNEFAKKDFVCEKCKQEKNTAGKITGKITDTDLTNNKMFS